MRNAEQQNRLGCVQMLPAIGNGETAEAAQSGFEPTVLAVGSQSEADGVASTLGSASAAEVTEILSAVKPGGVPIVVTSSETETVALAEYFADNPDFFEDDGSSSGSKKSPIPMEAIYGAAGGAAVLALLLIYCRCCRSKKAGTGTTEPSGVVQVP